MKKIKRVISILLTISMLFSILPSTFFVRAENVLNEETIEEDTSKYTGAYKEYLLLSDEEKAKIKVIPNKYKIPLDMLYENKENSSGEVTGSNLYGSLVNAALKSTSKDELPSKFNLSDWINILIEDQGQEGNCWTFPSLNSLETYLALNGYGEYDFSEKHLAYVESKECDQTEAKNDLFDGGNASLFKEYLEKGYGPVLEEDVPYNQEYTKEEYSELFNMDAKAFVEESKDFPTIEKKYEEYSEENLKKFRNEVKKHIMENGSLFANIFSVDNDSEYYNPETCAQYVPKTIDVITNHGVTIIGWDDNYSKENFNEANRPTKDGAYIVLNSWGNDFGDNGIFYISYEDAWVESGLFGITKATTTKNESKESITFEDNNLYNAFKDMIGENVITFDDQNLTLELSNQTIKRIGKIDFSNKGITNLSGMEKFTSVFDIDLSNNNLVNIESIAELKLTTLKLNNCNIGNEFLNQLNGIKCKLLELKNNNLSSIERLENVQNIITLDLSNNTSINISTIPSVKELILKNCNISDVTQLKIPSKKLTLSENNNIDISTIPTVEALILENCNISSLDGINMPTSELNLSNNPITSDNLDVFENSNLTNLNLSYTNITDVSKLNKIEKLDLSGNTNLQNISSLNLTHDLYLKDCGIEEYVDLLDLENLTTLNLSNNNITEIVELETNKNNLQINLDNNHIDVMKQFNESQKEYIASIKNQTVEMNIDIFSGKKNNLYELGYILSQIDLYESVEYNNCEMNYENKELVIEDNEAGVATVKIINGKRDGFTLNINYTPSENIELKGLIVNKEQIKRTYLAGENFDSTDLKVNIIYNNGCREEIGEFEILDDENLAAGSNVDGVKESTNVVIKFIDPTNNEPRRYNLPVYVYNESELKTLQFNDLEMYKAINDEIDNQYIAKSDESTKTIKIPTDKISEIKEIRIDNENITDLTGLSNLENLQTVELISGTYTDVTELNKLSNITQLTIGENANMNITELKEIYENANYEQLQLNKILDLKDAQIEDGKFVLPEYITYLKDKGNTITAFTHYGVRDNKYVQASKDESRVYQSENNLVIDLDTTTTNLHKDNNRYIEIVISGDKISNKSSLKMNYTADKVFDSIEVSQNPTKVEYLEGEKFDTTGMIVSKVYSDGSKEVITEYTVSPTEKLTIENKIITVSYTENGVTKTATVDISVKKKEEPKGEETKIEIPSTTIEGKKYITALTPENNDVATVISANKLDSTKVKITNAKGETLTGTSKLGTGAKIEILDNENNVIDTYTIAIKGDNNGDGKINLYDILRLIELVFDEGKDYNWSPLEKLAGECTGNNEVNLYDILRLIEYHFDGKDFR